MGRFFARLFLVSILILTSLTAVNALVWQRSALLNAASHTSSKTARVYAAANNNGFHAAYRDAKSNVLYYRRYINGNLTGPYDTGARNSYGSHEIIEALNGDVWVTWENWLPDAQGGEQVYATRSINGGVNWAWSPVTNYVYAPGEGGQGKNPGIVPIGSGSSAEVMSLTWRAVSNKMYHNRWNGSSWTGNIQDWSTDNSYAAEGWCRSLQDGSIYRTYGRKSGGIWQIFYRRFDGANWGPEFQVSTCTSTDDFPSRADIAVNAAGQILIAWDDNSHVWSRFYNPSTGWGSVVDVDPGYNVSLTSIPNRNDFYAVFSGGPNTHCAGKQFLNGSWYAHDVVSYGLANAFTPDMDVSAAPDGTLYVVFEYWGGGDCQQYYTTCRDFSGGADVTPPSAPIVYDDGVSTDISTFLHFSWGQAQDPESGIDHYDFSIGTSPGAANVVPWLYFGLNYERYQLGTYPPGVYYVNVRAWNRQGLVGPVGSSDGITITAVNTPYSFSAPAILSSSSYKSEYPGMARSSDGSLHLVFQDNNNNAQKVIYRKLSGGTWGTAEDVNVSPALGTYPEVVEDTNGSVHVVYGDSSARENLNTIERIKSGGVWGSPISVTTDTTMDWYPRVAAGSAGRLWLAQNGGGTSYTVKAVYKDTAWSTFTDLGTSSRYGNPDIATGPDGTAHMVWVQGSDIKYSKNTGSGWSTPTVAVTETGANGVRIGVDSNGNPAIIWRGTSAIPGATVCFSRFNGTNWSPRQVIGFGYSAAIAGDASGNIHVVYSMYDSTNDYSDPHYDIFHMVHNGTTWSTASNLSNSTGMSNQAAIETIGNNVYVAWSDANTTIPSIQFASALGAPPSTGVVSGVVKDKPGAPISGATVMSTTGGYVAVTNASGAYAITGIAPGTYSFTATKNGFSPITKTGVQITAGENTACNFDLSLVPPSPVIGLAATGSDALVWLYWTNPSEAAFTGTMVRAKTSGYPAGPTDGDLVCDRSAAPGSSDSFIHQGLVNGATYYYAAFAHSADGSCSDAATETAIPQATTIGQVKAYPEDAVVDLSNRIVTAVFATDGCIYIQEDDGTAGIRVDTNAAGIEVGHKVNIVGGSVHTIQTNGIASERSITGATVTKVSETRYQQKLVAIGSKSIGGSATGFFEGVSSAIGPNNMGLLVKVFGKVEKKEGDLLFINDGAGINSALSDGSSRIGVKVKVDIPPISEGDIISAVGIIVGDVPAGWTSNCAFIRCRTANDIRRFWPEVPVTGSIAGYVKDGADNPIPGASILTNIGGYSTTSGMDGAYTLAGVAAGTYSVTASKTGYSPQTRDSISVTAGSTTSCSFNLSIQPGTISGTVKDSNNSPIAGVTISTNTGGYTTTSAADGSYTLTGITPGTYSVTASKTNYNSQTNTGVVVTAGGTASANFNLQITPGTITGFVRNNSNTAISGAAVSTTTGGYTTTSGSDGSYTLPNVAPGTYTVTANKTGYITGTNSGVVVNAGAATTSNFSLVSGEKVAYGDMEGGFFNTNWANTCSGFTSRLPGPSVAYWGWNNDTSYPFNTFDAASPAHAGSHSLGFSFCQTASSPGKMGIASQNVYLGGSGASATFSVWAYHTDGNCPSIMAWNPGQNQNDPYVAYNNSRQQWVCTDNWGQRSTWVNRTMTVTADSTGYVTIMVGGAAHPGMTSGSKLYIDDVSVK